MKPDEEIQPKRKIVSLVTGEPYPLKINDLHDKKLIRIWTIFDIKKFNPKNEDLDTLPLIHNGNVFLEEKFHDWNLKDELLFYYSRITPKGVVIPLLIEYTS